jgi:hypothetical protein
MLLPCQVTFHSFPFLSHSTPFCRLQKRIHDNTPALAQQESVSDSASSRNRLGFSTFWPEGP